MIKRHIALLVAIILVIGMPVAHAAGNLTLEERVKALEKRVSILEGSPLEEPEPEPEPDEDLAEDAEVVSGDVTLDALHIASGKTIAFDPDTTTTLEVSGNVHVEGTLRMRPSSSEVIHTLRFVDVDESAFVGGHTQRPLQTDVGLWVTGNGILDAQGTPREAWNRSGTSPTWRSGDELRVTPTRTGNSTTFAEFSSGDRVPSVTDPTGGVHSAEVFNLTRNVIIEGTGNGSADPAANGRAHIMFLHCQQPQTISHVALRNLGP
jgi:hypothetical protein